MAKVRCLHLLTLVDVIGQLLPSPSPCRLRSHSEQPLRTLQSWASGDSPRIISGHFFAAILETFILILTHIKNKEWFFIGKELTITVERD